MPLTLEEVRKIASLARLRFSPREEELFACQLARILDYIDQLARFEAIPAEAAAGEGREAEDRPRPCLQRAVFLANAPAEMDGFLLVPEVKGAEDG